MIFSLNHLSSLPQQQMKKGKRIHGHERELEYPKAKLSSGNKYLWWLRGLWCLPSTRQLTSRQLKLEDMKYMCIWNNILQSWVYPFPVFQVFYITYLQLSLTRAIYLPEEASKDIPKYILNSASHKVIISYCEILYFYVNSNFD